MKEKEHKLFIEAWRNYFNNIDYIDIYSEREIFQKGFEAGLKASMEIINERTDTGNDESD